MELQTCSVCASTTQLGERSADDTFFCALCQTWRPCYPESEAKQRERAIAEKALIDAGTHQRL